MVERASGQGQEDETGRAGRLVWCGVTSGRRHGGEKWAEALVLRVGPLQSLGT